MNKTRLINTCILLLSIVLLFASCATGGANTDKASISDIKSSLQRGDAGSAIKTLRTKQDDYTDMNLFTLDFGMVNFYAQDYELASKALSSAEKAIEENQTKSIGQGISRAITNDYAMDYPGEKYEDIYINGFSALSYFLAGDFEDAMVEIRRAEIKLRDFKANADEESGMTKVLSKITRNPFSGLDGVTLNTADFTSSNFISYLSMMFYASAGKKDDARVDYEKISDNQHLAYETEEGKGRVNFVSFEGLIPSKQEASVKSVPLSFYCGTMVSVPYIGIKTTWPVLATKPGSRVTSVTVTASNGQSITLKELESFSDTARKALEKDTKATYLRSFYRGYMKMTTVATAQAIVLDEAIKAADTVFAKASSNPVTKMVADKVKLKAYTAAINLFIKSLDAVNESEKADLRMGQYLPDKSSAGTMSLDPGVYDFTVIYTLGATDTIQREIKNVEVKAGQNHIVVSNCLN